MKKNFSRSFKHTNSLARITDMDSVQKAYLNTLRCPLCKGQLDMSMGIKRALGSWICVNDPEHFGLSFANDDPPTCRISEEKLQLYHDKFLFIIIQSRFDLQGNPQTKTSMLIKPIDREGRVIEGVKTKSSFFDKFLFDFQNTTKEKIINRIETYLLFQ